MDRRGFFAHVGVSAAALVLGCRSSQHAHVLEGDDDDMVGSHTAGAETWKPLIDESVGKLLGRHMQPIQTVSGQMPAPRKQICFIGVENKSAEEIGDFKEQIYQQIDGAISGSQAFTLISRRFVEAGMRESRLRPDELFVPANQRLFAAAMERLEQPFQYLLYATITSGTTRSNGDYQRDYLLTLELVDTATGSYDKESAEIRKGYHKSRLSKLKHYG